MFPWRFHSSSMRAIPYGAFYNPLDNAPHSTYATRMTTPQMYKEYLRRAIVPVLDCGVSESTVQTLINTVLEVCNPNDVVTLTPRQINNVFTEIRLS